MSEPISQLLAGRQIDQEFLSQLEVLHDYIQERGEESKCPTCPGAVAMNPGDPRINVKPSEKVIMARIIATIKHKASGRVFVMYRDTRDAQFLESQDLIKFPKWLMDDPRKDAERSFRINEMLRAPKDDQDRDWLSADTLDDQTYDTLAYFVYLNRPSR